MKVLVTGVAGFIGSFVADALLSCGDEVIGLDSLNDYYNPQLKKDRLKFLEKKDGFKFYQVDLAEYNEVEKVFKENKIDKVLNLAAQAGVRYSLKNPLAYQRSNLQGFVNLLEMVRNFEVPDLVFASSSSVYGNQEKVPFSETDNVDRPISLYAATKKSNELMAYTYHHLYGINCTGLRFFTVYGPWGRPDMAYFSFSKKILSGETIQVFNQGKLRRDFTYIDDIVAGVLKTLDQPFEYEIINLGNNQPVELMHFIEVLEKELGTEAKKEMLGMQPGDVYQTYADISKAKKLLDWQPTTSIEQGLKKFVEWYKMYYHISQ